MRLGCLLTGAGLLMVFMGGRGIYQAAVSGKQKTMPYTQFVQQHPGIGWYHITNAGWDIVDSMYVEEKDSHTVKKVFLPVHVSGGEVKDSDKINVILETDREDLCHLMETASKDNGQSLLTLPESASHFNGAIDGTVAFSGDMDSDDRELMRSKLGGRLDANYVVIKDGDKPNAGLGFLAIVGGVLLTGGGVAILGGRSRQ